MNFPPRLAALALVMLAIVPASGETRVGIGVMLEIDSVEQLPSVVNVIPDSPADKAGLPKGAIIGKINGIPTAGMTIEECVAKLRGPDGIPVLLEIVDPATGKPKKIMIVRGKFKVGS